VVAGVLFAILPRTTYMGIETRSFALSAAVAVWATLVLLIAARRPSWRWWVLYALAVVTGTYLFLYSVLLLAVHAVALLLDHRTRTVMARWLVAAGVVVVACVPLLIVSVGQKEQIAWLSDQPVVNVWTILVEPAFDSSWLVAAIVWITILVLAMRGRGVLASRDGDLLRLAAVWVLLPLVLLLGADAVIGPLYTARYLSFTVPGMAILLAVAFTRTPRAGVTWILVGAVGLAGLPTYLAQRGPVAKNGGSDLAQIADYIDTQARPDDAIYLQDTGAVTFRPRQALYAYPEKFADVRDVAFIASFTTTGTFSDVTAAWPDIRSQLENVDRIWVVEAGSSMADTNALLLPLGYLEHRPYQTNRSVIALYELPPTSQGDG
jgi:mannosyltransferase